MDGEGRMWARKLEANVGGPWEMLAEPLGYLLGHAIGVRVPEIAVCLAEGQRASLSSQISPAQHWDATHADKLVNYAELGAMITLDVLILNSDRHGANILLEPYPDGANLRSWAIDAGVASICEPRRYAVESERERVPRCDKIKEVAALPLGAMLEGAQVAAVTATELSDIAIRSFCEEACEIARVSESQILFETLRKRCDRAESLLIEFWDRMEAS